LLAPLTVCAAAKQEEGQGEKRKGAPADGKGGKSKKPKSAAAAAAEKVVPKKALPSMFKGGKDPNAIKKKKAATAEADDLLKDMLGDMGGPAPAAKKKKLHTAGSVMPEEMVDFTTFDTSNYESSKRRKSGYDAFDAPPPSAAAMTFDDEGGVEVEDAPQMSEEERKIQEEIEELERQSKLSKLKAKLEATKAGVTFEDPEADEAPQAKTPSGPSTSPATKTPAPEDKIQVDGVTPRVHKTAKVDGSFWENQAADAEDPATASAPLAPAISGLAPGTNSVCPPFQPNGKVHFYWFDACEDPIAFPGTVYLFGKVYVPEAKAYASCSVEVNNMERCMLFLPRKNVYDEDEGQEIDGQPVSMNDVYAEVQGIMHKSGIKKFMARPSTKKYCFEKAEIPAEAEYLKAKYPYTSPSIKDQVQGGGRTFSHTFATGTTALEHFVVKRKLGGPQWLSLDVPQAEPSQNSWCKYSIKLPNMKCVNILTENVPPAPTLTTLSLSLKCVKSATKTLQDEIIMASCVVNHGVPIDLPCDDPRFEAFTGLRRLNGVPFPADLAAACKRSPQKVEPCGSEHALLAWLMSKIQKTDPDVIVGHAINALDLEVLLKRMEALKTPHYSRLGRLRRGRMPDLKGNRIEFAKKQVMAGRLLCDTWISSKEMLMKEKNYTLSNLAARHLKIQCAELEQSDYPQYYRGTQSLMELATHTAHGAWVTSMLMHKMQVLPLTKQLTGLAGNLWQKSLFSQRAERIEYLLLHEFHRLKYAVPDKASFKDKKAAEAVTGAPMDDDGIGGPAKQDGNWKKRKKAAYAGGLVLEPKRGFYDKCVLLLDFNSLYPSIIQEYNIDFTTVKYDKTKKFGELAEGEDPLSIIPEVPDQGQEEGVLPRLIRTIVTKRRAVKDAMKKEKDPAKLKVMDVRQLALKIMANSMYGCLGFTHSRFYAKPLAALVTFKGREILQDTMDLSNDQMGHEVIYGDTDSIMVYTATDDLQEVKKIGNEIKREVNKKYRLLEIEIDGVMQSMLLLNKKKYAALMVEEKNGVVTLVKETKGLDLVRRDWCELSPITIYGHTTLDSTPLTLSLKCELSEHYYHIWTYITLDSTPSIRCELSQDVGNFVLDRILSGAPREEVVQAIHEYLTVVAADVRANKIPLRKYIINKCLTKPPSAYPDKASLPHVFVATTLQARGDTVPVGSHIQYCITKNDDKSIPVAKRAVHPDQIERADGLIQVDPEWYLSTQIHPPISRLLNPIEGTDSGRIAECLGLDPSKFRHQIAKEDEEEAMPNVAVDDKERFRDCGPLEGTCPSCLEVGKPGEAEWPKRLNCAKCSALYPMVTLKNGLTTAIRAAVTKFNDGWMVCEESTCPQRTRMLSLAYTRTDKGLSEVGRQCLRVGCHGRMEKDFSDKALYTQMVYLQSLFDYQRVDRMAERFLKGKGKEHLMSERVEEQVMSQRKSLQGLTAHVQEHLRQSDFNMVNLQDLFSGIFGASKPIGM